MIVNSRRQGRSRFRFSADFTVNDRVSRFELLFSFFLLLFANSLLLFHLTKGVSKGQGRATSSSTGFTLRTVSAVDYKRTKPLWFTAGVPPAQTDLRKNNEEGSRPTVYG